MPYGRYLQLIVLQLWHLLIIRAVGTSADIWRSVCGLALLATNKYNTWICGNCTSIRTAPRTTRTHCFSLGCAQTRHVQSQGCPIRQINRGGAQIPMPLPALTGIAYTSLLRTVDYQLTNCKCRYARILAR